MLKSIENLREYASKVIESPQYISGESFDLMVFADEIEREIAERYMELPCDCDGVPIQMWDRVKAEGYEDGKVASIEVRGNGTDWIGVLPDGWDTPTVYCSDCLRHYKPRTVEDVLREYGDAVDRLGQANVDMSTYAGELRKLLGGDAE